MISFLGFFQTFEIFTEFILGREGGAVNALQLLVFKKVIEVEHVLRANAVGIAEKLVAHTVEGVLVLGHVFAGHMVIGQHEGREHDDHFALHRGVFFALEKRPQDRQVAQQGHLVHGALFVLRNQPADDERRVVQEMLDKSLGTKK